MHTVNGTGSKNPIRLLMSAGEPRIPTTDEEKRKFLRQNPIGVAMLPICLDCGENVLARWIGEWTCRAPWAENEAARRYLEEAVARMISTEHARRPIKPSEHHGKYYDRVLTHAISANTHMWSPTAGMLILCESLGLAFDDAMEYRSFFNGLLFRLGIAAGDQIDPNAVKRVSEGVLVEIATHAAHLSKDERARLREGDVLLGATDLFAEGAGQVAMCSCLRVASRFHRTKARWEEIVWYFRLFGPERVDDLAVLLADERLRPDDYAALLEAPDAVRTRSLEQVQALLALWKSSPARKLPLASFASQAL